MYKFYEKSKAVREVQKYLDAIFEDEYKPAQSGNYDDKTRDNVISFQKSMELPPTGAVDLETFNLLYETFTKAMITRSSKENSRQNLVFPFKKGDYSSAMGELNALIAEILSFYGIENFLREQNYFSNQTEKALESLGRLFGLSPQLYVDEILYDRILKEAAHIHKD